ncbi:type VI secretion system baseplate subunit TssK [Sphingomonas jatrophae]|uniref:Type VI secretion system protein ImpJ n=1 Tax=Sphingomonas jatrophae TaxID=1166337 RepID=A0A1I6M252_9SPHN|nr:type VI secretion system baseplate subunit TssK [Sphingomonas jatrophae]SFS09786.1 type VI secretion system protein ImpJ [Sphingomonas jatrophae]
MYWNNKVLWSEGMFLRTQHFQQFERYIDRRSESGLRWLNPLGYGFAELEIDQALLRTGSIALSRAAGVLPDGTMFDAPGADDQPQPLAVPVTLKNSLIHLALPIRRAGAYDAHLKAGQGAPLRWVGQEVQVNDVVAGTEGTAPITVAKLDLRLIDDAQELAGYVTLPVCRLVERRADGSLVLDPDFIPTSVSCDVSAPLRGFLAEIRGLLQHRGAAIAGRLADPGGKSIAEITDFLILMLVNRNETVVSHLADLRDVHPVDLYRTLLGLAGELATFTETGSNRPPEFPAYNHNDLQASFAPVIAFLRESLSAVFEQTAIPIPLEQRAYGIRVARITDRSLFTDCTFVLAARSSIDAELLRENMPKRTKIGAVERIRDLVNLQLGGAPIRPLQAEPRQIPFRAGMTYFEINTSAEDWRLVERSGGAAIHVSGDVPDLDLELWAIRGRIR